MDGSVSDKNRIAIIPDGQDRSPEPHQQKPTYKMFDVALNSDGVPHPEICGVLDRNMAAFSLDGTPGRIKDGTEISLKTEDSKLTPQSARRVGPEKEKVIRKTIQQLLEWKVIEKSNSKTSYPIVLAWQNEKWRFCVDYRKLNEVTVGDKYPMQRMDQVFDALTNMSFFSILDAICGYHQIPIAKKDRWKTAFISIEGLFQYITMPFGLKNSGAVFQRFMDAILGSLRWVAALAYIDDVILFSKTIAQHANDLDVLLQRAIASGLKFAPNKCHFGYTNLALLGRIVGRDGLQVDKSRAQAVLDMKEPTNMKELYTAIGMFGSYRAFIYRFALIAAPLTSITTGNKFRRQDGTLTKEWQSKPITWGEPQKKAYRELKALIASPPVLAFPDFSLRFYLYIDACKSGFALAIHQRFPKQNKETQLFPTFNLLDDPVVNNNLNRWKSETQNDTLFGPIAKKIENHPSYRIGTLGLLLVRRTEGEQICVSKSLLKEIFHDTHDAVGHPGFARSWDLCSRQYFRPSLSVLLKQYISFCPTCIRTKPKRRPSQGEMPESEIEPVAFQSIAMDFVTGLPPSNGFDCILLIVDLFTKCVILIPTISSYTASSVADDFFKHVVRRGFLPTRFVSDNDKVFIGAFWKHLTSKLKIKCNFTSPYHAQSDPAERYNQTMEAMLRAWTLSFPDSWTDSLLYVEIAMNSLKSSPTGYAPYELLYTNHSGPTDRLQSAMDDAACASEDVDNIVAFAKQRLRDAYKAIQTAHQTSKEMYDGKHSPIIPFKVGDWAMIKLSLRPIKIANRSKLTEPLLGPYKVITVHPRSVVLDIPSHLKIHPRFSIQHLELCPSPESDPYNRQLRPQHIETIEGEDAYEVEKLIGKRTYGRSKLVQYLVKWRDYPASESTWEFEKDLAKDGCQDAIDEFESRQENTEDDIPPMSRPRIHATPPRETTADSEGFPASTGKPTPTKQQFDYNQPNFTERPINFESRVTRDYESRYEALKLELACLTWAVLKSVKYLEGNQFTVYTDHENIKSVLSTKSDTLYSRQVDKFRILLMPYLSSMEILHRPGKFHHNVDALSRLTGPPTSTSSKPGKGDVANDPSKT